MTFVQYILGNFWHFIGFITILSLIIKGIAIVVGVILNRNVDIS